MKRAKMLVLTIGASLGALAILAPGAAAQDIAPSAAVAPLAPVPAPAFPFGEARYRSPGLAVALSLQPLPIDFGNLYAENIGWGMAYTAIEVSLMAPMMWMTGEHMNHGTADNRTWSGRETGAMVGLVSAYVVVKLLAGLHAGYASRAFTRAYEPPTMGFVAPVPGGALLAWSRTF
jgi:hypothetical protein